jgi:hypothetical protein
MPAGHGTGHAGQMLDLKSKFFQIEEEKVCGFGGISTKRNAGGNFDYMPVVGYY